MIESQYIEQEQPELPSFQLKEGSVEKSDDHGALQGEEPSEDEGNLDSGIVEDNFLMPQVRKHASGGVVKPRLECNNQDDAPIFKAYITPEIDLGRDSGNMILVVEDNKFNICAILGLF